MSLKFLPILFLVVACAAPSPYAEGPSLGENPNLLGPNITEEIANGEFFIGPGDKVTLAFWQHTDLSRPYQVRIDGTMNLHLVGKTAVSGLTLEGLQLKLETAYEQCLVKPSLDLTVEYTSSRKVTILGQINNSGIYPLANPRTSVLDMIAQAGGISEDGDKTAVLIARLVQGQVQINAYNLDLLWSPPDAAVKTQIPYVQPGDYIYVLTTALSEYQDKIAVVSDTLRTATFAQRTILMTESAAAAFQGD